MLAIPPLLWAGNVVVGRMAVGGIDALWLNAYRWILAFALLLPLGWKALSTPAARAEIRARWGYLALLGLLGVGSFNALMYVALRTSTPLNVALIAASTSVWSMVLGVLFYRIRPNPLGVIGAALSLAGVATVLSNGDPTSLLRVQLAQGDLLMLIAVLGWSAYGWLLARPPAHMVGSARPRWDWAEFLIVQFVFGMLVAAAAAGINETVNPTPPTQWSAFIVFAVLFVAIAPSIIAFRLWGLAVAETGPAVAAVFYNLMPLFTALLAAALLGEWPKPYHALAFSLIVVGIILSSRGAPMRKP